MSKYVVVPKSATGHCCFEASVIDADKERFDEERVVCECFMQKTAERIAALLNGHNDIEEQVR